MFLMHARDIRFRNLVMLVYKLILYFSHRDEHCFYTQHTHIQLEA